MKLWQKLTDLFDEGGVQAEMTKRYKDTILNIKSGSVNIYATYRGINDAGFYTFKDIKNQTIQLAYDTDVEVAVPKLEPGCYNTNTVAVHVSPIPARQWKRGLCKANTVITPIYQSLGGFGHLTGSVFDTVINQVLDPKLQRELTLDEAKEVAQTLGSVAINRDFSVMLDPVNNTSVLYLFYHRALIGTISDNQIQIKNTAFKQEVLDTQRSWCENYEVI